MTSVSIRLYRWLTSPEIQDALLVGGHFVFGILSHVDEMFGTFVAEKEFSDVLANGDDQIGWFDRRWY